MSTLQRDDAFLQVFDQGSGLPVVFQHGLGGDQAQVAQVFPDGAYRRITVECRGQGGSTYGETRPFTFAMFADDVLATADRAGIERFVAGGISMGAAIALRLAVRHPDRVIGLVMIRPAWAFDPGPANMDPVKELAHLIATRPLAEARQAFVASATARHLADAAPDNLASLLGYFARPDAAAVAEVLADIAGRGPCVPREQAAALAVPTLIVGCARDAVHPLAMARTLAETIPGARIREVTPKATDRELNAAETRDAIAAFLETAVAAWTRRAS